MYTKAIFPAFQRLGVYITPNHYYYPIPDTSKLRAEVWQRLYDLVGINVKTERMIDLLLSFSSKYREEYEAFPKVRSATKYPYQYFINNGSFESVDGEIYYCMIREFKPRRIVEVGAGYSTHLAAQALLKNEEEGVHGELIAIDPYPSAALKEGFHGLSRLIARKAQDVDLSLFTGLKENDILFIDSTHVVKIGGDVPYLYLQVIHRLAKGVLVHIHDIFLPSEYPRDWIKNCIFWSEQYLLYAFLLFNDTFEILWMGSLMHLKYPELLEKAFTSYHKERVWPGSFWMRRVN